MQTMFLSPEQQALLPEPARATRRLGASPEAPFLSTVRSSLSEIGTIFAGVYAPAFFFQMLKSTVYFFVRKRLYHNVPMNGGVW